MIEIIAGVIVLILAIIGIAKLAQRRGGEGAGELTLEQLQNAAYLAKDQINDVYSGKIGEAVGESGNVGASVSRAYDGLKRSESVAMRKLEIERSRIESYFQLFRLQRVADKTAKLVYRGIREKTLSEGDGSEYAKEILGAFGRGEKGLYKLTKKVISG